MKTLEILKLAKAFEWGSEGGDMKLLVNLASFYWILFFYFIHNEYFLLPIAINDKYFSVLIYLIFGFFLGLIIIKIHTK